MNASDEVNILLKNSLQEAKILPLEPNLKHSHLSTISIKELREIVSTISK